MFGGFSFGNLYYGRAGGQQVRPPTGAVSPGGSGFPDDWFRRLDVQSPEDLEVADLIAVGVV